MEIRDEEMRRAWRELTQRVSQLEKTVYNEQVAKAVNPNAVTALGNLAKKYRRFSLIGIIMFFVSIGYGYLDFFPEHMRLLVSVSMMIYFLTVALMDNWLYRRVSDIDVMRMNVSEVSREAMFCRKRHLQFVAILIPMAIAVVIALFMALQGNPYAIWGGIAGLVIGLASGSMVLRSMMAEYKKLNAD